MIRPGVIEPSSKVIQDAPFVSEAQKRDILLYWATIRLAAQPSLTVPTTLAYGVVPPGYAEARRPTSLPFPPGAYEVDIVTSHGHALAYFWIGNDGRLK